jgi:hypothetical protein
VEHYEPQPAIPVLVLACLMLLTVPFWFHIGSVFLTLACLGGGLWMLSWDVPDVWIPRIRRFLKRARDGQMRPTSCLARMPGKPMIINTRMTFGGVVPWLLTWLARRKQRKPRVRVVEGDGWRMIDQVDPRKETSRMKKYKRRARWGCVILAAVLMPPLVQPPHSLDVLSFFALGVFAIFQGWNGLRWWRTIRATTGSA